MAYVIDRNRDAAFLKEEELDLVTYHKFAAGDKVVVCASCNQVHLESSWNGNNGTCPGCGAASTKKIKSLDELTQLTVLSKRGGRGRRVDRGSTVTPTRNLRPIRPLGGAATGATRTPARTATGTTGTTTRTTTGTITRSATATGATSGNRAGSGAGSRRRRFRPFRLLVAALIIFLLYAPVKDLIMGYFFPEVEASGDDFGSNQDNGEIEKTADTGVDDWINSEPIDCIVVAPGCNVRTSPEVLDDNVIAQLPYGTSVNWTDALVDEETGTSWFYVTAQDGSETTGWVSGKVIDYIYDVEVPVNAITLPEALASAEREYTAADLLDGYCLTTWYAEGDGNALEITLEYDETVVRGVCLTNGDVSSKEAYESANRICDIEFIFDNGESYYTTITDEYRYGGMLYKIDTDTPSTSVTIRANSIYAGEVPHLAISDISLYETGLDRTTLKEGWQ